LFTDIEGSTQLWESAPAAMQPALERHDALLQAAIDAHDGYVVKTTGDGVYAAFARAGDAVAAAVEIQQVLSEEPWPDRAVVRVRIGVHTGEASERDGDYFGPAVNRAARLMAVAHGGQVVCSQSTAALAGDGVARRSLGEHRLRDLAAAEQVFQVGDGVFPPLRSVDAVPTNLPTVRTELIGRTDDVTALTELVERERLVTLTGVGGVGKTRLALGVAAAIAAGFADGCWLVELSPVADGQEVLKTVAAAIGAPTTTADALVAYLAERRVLIVLDNCEHLLDAAADLVDAVLAECADVHVLVTSREPLGLDGEQVRRVQSLELPDAQAAPADAEAAAAVRLFTERAASVRAGFVVDAANVAAVVEICRHLDGIPLAIELAAARVRAMAPAEIARRLDERFRLLAGGSRRSQERHRTLLATVSWSHDLLSDDEKIVFRRLAVFPATFDLAAAEAVAGDGTLDVVDCILRLVDRSLVMFEPDQDRYRLLETLRQYGADRLAEAAETDETRGRHARYFLTFAERVSPSLNDARYLLAQPVVTAELDNLRATADWCVEAKQWVQLAGMCHHLWQVVLQYAPIDAAAWYQHVVDHASVLDGQVVIDTLGEFAWLEVANLGNFAASTERAERSLARSSAENLLVSPWACIAQSQSALYTGQNAEALRAAEHAYTVAEERGDELLAIVALLEKVSPNAILGDVERSEHVAADALRRAERTGHPIYISAAVITVAGNDLWGRAEPDPTAALGVLERHGRDLGLLAGGLNGAWYDITWGVALSELGLPGAIEHLARAARSADRLNTQHALDLALRQLAIAAAEAGLMQSALALTGYTEANLRPYRIENPGQTRIQARLDRALAPVAGPASERALHRGEIMALVAEIETSLARDETPARLTTD
jgi:predicted ATPase